MAKTKKYAEEKSLEETIAEDERVERYTRIARSVKKNINLSRLDEEMARLHAGRKSRTLFGRVPGPDVVIEASLQNSQTRSRLAEMRLECTQQQALLKSATDTIRRYLVSEYGALTGLRTKIERSDYFSQYIERGTKLLHELDSFVSRVDYLIRDIDQTGYDLKAVIDCMNIVYSHKNDRKNV